MSPSTKTGVSKLRHLPSVDQLLKLPTVEQKRSIGTDRVKAFARLVLSEMRSEIQSTKESDSNFGNSPEDLLAEAGRRLEGLFTDNSRSGLCRVINATGVILHTNLGRAPLSPGAQSAIQNAAGYCSIEFDLVTGSRGRRGGKVEDLLKLLTNAEDALIVNNCASAALLVLTALAHDGETIVSRGELVEIGGDFRVPDVLANSGTRMVEVGTTNRTKLDDYRKAISQQTRLIMRIHPSNYRIVGFTASPSLEELASIAKEAKLPLYEDAGSGVLNDLSAYGLTGEPIIKESVIAGANVVSFSGDKLLGSAQAGILVGDAAIIDRLRRHSLYRALRADKLCLAALEATLESHARETAVQEIPALRMLSMTAEEIAVRAKRLKEQLGEVSGLSVELVAGESAIGGGSGPNTHPATKLIALKHTGLSANEIEDRLRQFSPPVIARIADDRVMIDLRTVEESQESHILAALRSLNSR
jgi:L-seryl-tRNA(Ser) seleniumtransferase